MPIAIWTPALSLGVDSLDADHQKLIDTLNMVFDAMLFDRSSAALHSALATLDDYVTGHFAREEAWMQARDHPDLARWLMEQGIESVSLNPDSVLDTWFFLAEGQQG